MENKESTAGQKALKVNLIEILQSKDFESDIHGAANKLNRNAAARIRAYRHPNGIWKAAAFALGFSTCLRYWERHPQKDDDTDRCNADE